MWGAVLFWGHDVVNSQAPGGRRKFSWPLAFTLIVLTLAGVCAFIFWRIETWPGRAANQTTAQLERVGRDVRDAFVDMAQLKPRVIVNNRIYLEKTTATAQLAILSRQVEVEDELLHTWAGSTKRVKLHATFTAKAGFDLQQDVAVDLRPDEVAISLPHATILGVEQKQIDVLAFENGFWNRISASDLEGQLATLPELARQKAAESGILEEAEMALQTQLNERIHAERPVHLLFHSAAGKE
jgi:flagellar basal body-associated protein FliL